MTNASKLGNWARDNAKRKGPGGGQKKTGVIEVNVGGEIEEDDDDDEEVDLERGDVQAFVELIETNIRNAWVGSTVVWFPLIHID